MKFEIGGIHAVIYFIGLVVIALCLMRAVGLLCAAVIAWLAGN